MQLSDRIGRRLKLHDIHVFMSVVQAGGMGKAAKALNTTQSAVSRSVAELEHAIGVRLLDRNRQGIHLTAFGKALLDGGATVFDDLRQTVKHIEFLSDPTLGHVSVASNEVTSAGLLPAVFARLHRQHPGLSMQVLSVLSPAQQYRDLRERRVDLVVGRIAPAIDDDILTEVLFRDRIVVVTGAATKWARRRKVELPDLADEPWCLPPPDAPVGALVASAFRAHKIKFPPKGSAIGSLQLFATLVASEPFLAIYPESMLRLATTLPPLKILPIELPDPVAPVGIMTLKNRTLSPTTRLFIECAREVAKPLAAERGRQRS